MSKINELEFYYDQIKDYISIEKINELIAYRKKQGLKENDISDGYHTFNELYEFRKVYNAALFNEWAEHGKYDVHKSKLHNDGEVPFGDPKWFIVVAMLPDGQISNHYKMNDWDMFNIPETDKAKYPFDGHTGKDVIQRIKNVNSSL